MFWAQRHRQPKPVNVSDDENKTVWRKNCVYCYLPLLKQEVLLPSFTHCLLQITFSAFKRAITSSEKFPPPASVYQMCLLNAGCRIFKYFYSGNKLLLIPLTVSLEQGVHINCPNIRLQSACRESFSRHSRDWEKNNFEINTEAELPGMLWGRLRTADFQLGLESLKGFIVFLRKNVFQFCVRFLQVLFLIIRVKE